MEDSRTYRQYAEECRKLEDSLPKHRKHLLDMAAVWADLAEKADAKSKEEDKVGVAGSTTRKPSQPREGGGEA